MKKEGLDLSELSLEDLEKMSSSLAVSESEFPSLFVKPNIAQYRAFHTIYTKVNGHFPDMISVEFANGVGKTTQFALDVVGWTMGSAYLQEELYPPEAIAFWDSLTELRDRGRLALRLVCSNVDIKEGGSVCDILKKFFPWARLTKQDTTGSYKQIDIPHPTIPGVVNHIAVLTFDQVEEKHSGSTCDRIWVNENLPENLWNETNARTRGGGNIVQFATILGLSTHLNELEGGESFILERCKGHIYENCRGEEVTESMAMEVENEIGVQMDKNPKGPGYITRGNLSKHKIDAMIEGWMKTNPDQVQARKTGRPVSEGGKIFPCFNAEVHRIPAGTYDRTNVDLPMVMLCDPHPARPDAVIWCKILSNDRLAIVDEWPSFSEFGYYDKIKDTRFTIKQKCSIWTEREASKGYTNKIVARIGDPNAFLSPDEQSSSDISSLYAKEGFHFQTTVKDDFEYGREVVNQYLWYDSAVRKLMPSDPSGWPRIVIYENCINMLRALDNYSIKVKRDKTLPTSLRADERFGCFCALIRYLCVWHTHGHHYNDIKVNPNRVSDYELVRRGRTPAATRSKTDSSRPHNTHGRQVLTSMG